MSPSCYRGVHFVIFSSSLRWHVWRSCLLIILAFQKYVGKFTKGRTNCWNQLSMFVCLSVCLLFWNVIIYVLSFFFLLLKMYLIYIPKPPVCQLKGKYCFLRCVCFIAIHLCSMHCSPLGRLHFDITVSLNMHAMNLKILKKKEAPN